MTKDKNRHVRENRKQRKDDLEELDMHIPEGGPRCFFCQIPLGPNCFDLLCVACDGD